MNTNSYFTVEILTAGTVIIQLANATGSESPGTIYYWINSVPNATRDNYDGSIVPSGTAQYIRVNSSNPPVGTIIRLYRPETTALCFGDGGDNGSYVRIHGTAETKISGNMASLIGFSETITAACFRYIFYSSNIIDAGELDLPWTTLSQYCFARMFFNNQKLTEPPVLPATTLATHCYYVMFRNCIKLEKISDIKCETINNNTAFYCMYQLCSNLKKVHIKKFHFIDGGRFWGVFWGSGLIEATVDVYNDEEIPANAYSQLFTGCTNLSKVTCNATNFNSGAFNQWLNNVSSTGTFIKDKDTTWSEGVSGIPTGWTVKNMNQYTQSIDFNRMASAFSKGNISLSAIYGIGNVLLWGTPVIDYSSKYFTVKILTSDSGRLYYRCDSGYEWTVEYSKNNGNWISLTANQSYGIGISNYISVAVGDEIRFRKTGTSSSTVACSYLWSNTCTFEAYGNIMSLAYGDNFIGQTTIPGESYFRQFFANNESLGAANTYLKSADNLVMPATTLTDWCYANMFYNCNVITIGPTILPATTLQNHCYYSMFTGCSSLTKAPILPATTLVSGCYDSMFANNTSLQYIKAMFTTDPGGEQYNGPCANWVLNVPSGGTFVKNSAATWNRTGANAVPSGWTIEYA